MREYSSLKNMNSDFSTSPVNKNISQSINQSSYSNNISYSDNYFRESLYFMRQSKDGLKLKDLTSKNKTIIEKHGLKLLHQRVKQLNMKNNK